MAIITKDPHNRSRPTRARGLKPPKHGMILYTYWSRPTRARGLKQSVFCLLPSPFMVAPHAGAWIETRKLTTGKAICASSRAPRGRVD